MTDHADRYYRSAGAVPFAGILLVSACGFVAAAICGGLYALADWYIAYDIVPFLCAPLAGAGIGGAIKGGAILGRVRHRGFLGLVGLAMGLVGAYSAWVVFLRVWDGGGVWVWDPAVLLSAIGQISEFGVWDNQPTGIWLKLIYAVEALTFMVLASVVASLPSRPFCDSCNAWTGQVPEVATLRLSDPEALRLRLEESQYEAMDELFDPAADPRNCFRASVWVCPSCDASNYLTVSHLTVVNNGGETHQNEEKFVNALWVPHDVVEQVKGLAERWTHAHSLRPEVLASASQAGTAEDEDTAAVV